jgi:hypothetical protein
MTGAVTFMAYQRRVGADNYSSGTIVTREAAAAWGLKTSNQLLTITQTNPVKSDTIALFEGLERPE